jgi:hypothetical protein
LASCPGPVLAAPRTFPLEPTNSRQKDVLPSHQHTGFRIFCKQFTPFLCVVTLFCK